jgi:primosomal protein N' (replication factor Y)
VVVDEEHDSSYKSERTPRFQARDVAVRLGELAHAPVILGSATPDVASLGKARRGDFQFFEIPDRVAGALPQVEVVDLRAELGAGNRGLLSRRLTAALGELDTQAGDQAILMINRRGAATVIVCRDCGYVQICPECQRPLVFHSSSQSLRCHHCGATAPVARRCPACDSPRIRYLGGGTERVEREVSLRFPRLRVGRLDRDVVERRGGAVKVIDQLAAGDLDVLVGTALVAKGIDVPQVTLVGVVSADVSLNLPDERAAERTYQLLAQVVGRAGRGDKQGRALIQTYMPDHPVVRAVTTGEAGAFYDAELEARRLFRSPPFGAIVKLTVALDDRAAAHKKGAEMAAGLRDRAEELEAEVEVLGPVPAYIARRAGKWRFHVILRGDEPRRVLGTDPGVPWSVDVDPESLL